MKEIDLLPCPFCGSPGVVSEHGYSDHFCEVGCVDENCSVQPVIYAVPKTFPHDESKQTFWKDWDSAKKEAAHRWNTRSAKEARE